MSAKFVRRCSLMVCSIVIFDCARESMVRAQSQDESDVTQLDGGGDPFTRSKNKPPIFAVGGSTQPLNSHRRDVSAEVLDRETEAKLAKVVGDNFRFDDTPFGDVVTQIKGDTDLNILVDPSADGDLQEDTPITFELSGVSLEKALQMMLRRHCCDFIIDNGIIRIISLDVAKHPEFFMLRIYDCSKLIQAVPSLLDRPAASINPPSGTVTERVVVDPAIPADILQALQKRPVDAVPQTQLVRVVLDTVTPRDWALTGTGDGILNQVGDCLVVSHSRRGHRDLQDLIVRMESKLIQK